MAAMASEEHSPEISERQADAEATYRRLFGPRDANAPANDPELMEILRGFIFGDIFGTGVLDDQARGSGLPADPAAVDVAHGGGPRCRRPAGRDP